MGGLGRLPKKQGRHLSVSSAATQTPGLASGRCSQGSFVEARIAADLSASSPPAGAPLTAPRTQRGPQDAPRAAWGWGSASSGRPPPPAPRQPTSQSHFLDALKALQLPGSGAPPRSAMNLRPGLCDGICWAQERRGRGWSASGPCALTACVLFLPFPRDLYRATLKLTFRRGTR